MPIINFSCHQCNDNRDRYYPLIKIQSLNKALEHLKEFPNHEIFILEDETTQDEE